MVSILDLIATHLSEQGIWCRIYLCHQPYMRFASYRLAPYHFGTISQEETYIKVEQFDLIHVERFDLTDPQSLAKLVEYVKTGH